MTVTLPEEDWDELAAQGRPTASTFSGCLDREYSYDYFLADVTIDGENVSDVDIRKKGFLGSISLSRPSLKLNFGRGAHDGRTFRGSKRMTLNNNRQDVSNARQCLFYGLFERAGLVAPRCGLARVEVNGRDLGVYSRVEPIKKPFLARHFDSDDGNLYEAQLADFTRSRIDNFEQKTNEREGDRSDLDRVVEALEAPDDELLDALSQVFDMKELFRFWALESLGGHWDGMMGNGNNHYVYHDPTDDLFHPIPWGADLSFTGSSPFGAGRELASVLTTNVLGRRLYAIPEARTRYHDALRSLLETVWDEEALLEEARRITELTEAPAASLMELVAFIEGRRAAVMEELDQHDGTGPDPLERTLPLQECVPPPESGGQFEVAWSDAMVAMAAYRPLQEGALELMVPLPSGDLVFDEGPLLGTAFRESEPRDNDPTAIRLGFLGRVDGRQVVVQFTIPASLYGPGEIPFHGTEVWGLVIELTEQAPGFRLHAVIADGSLTLEEAGMEDGEPVRGSWRGKVAPLSPGLR